MSELNPLTLPLTGRQLIEASAGTGKTYNITKIYVRLILEQRVQVQNILVMTFTNAATQELRIRLDQEIRLALKQWQAPDDISDVFYTELVPRYSKQEAELLLNRALQNLDQSAVFTIHGFCKRVLADQAFESQMRFDSQIDTDMSDLYLQAVQDWYRVSSGDTGYQQLIQKWPTPDAFYQVFSSPIRGYEPLVTPPVDITDISLWRNNWQEESEAFYKAQVKSRRSENIKAHWQHYLDQLETLSSLHGEVSDEPELLNILGSEKDFIKKSQLYPEIARSASVAVSLQQQAKAEKIRNVVNWCRDRIQASKQQKNIMDFDDLILNLNNRLQQSPNNHLAQVLADKYPIALVDEFQDTDALQYAIFDQIYAAPNAQLLVMIGDPKQAIYGFRGGDVFAYLAARNTADTCWDMGRNFRSTPGVIQGYNHLFSMTDPSSFDFGIDYKPVAAGIADMPEMEDAAKRSPFQWVEFQGDPLLKDAQWDLAHWTSQEIRRLTQQARIKQQPVLPQDIAILVRSGAQAHMMRQSLSQHGLDSVFLSDRENLWQSSEALQLLLALKGVQKPEDQRLMVAALSTHWFSVSPTQLHALATDDSVFAYWHDRLSRYLEIWKQHGLLSMAFKILSDSYTPIEQQRERMLTNDLHLLEIMQSESHRFSDPLEAIQWLENQIKQQPGEHELRLESDGNLIKIVTMHSSKGLEYPIVFLPFVSYGSKPRSASTLVRIHDETTKQSQSILLPDERQLKREQREQNAELVRLLYVAATRGINRTYVLAAPFKSYAISPLALATGCSEIGELRNRVTDLLAQPLPIHSKPWEEQERTQDASFKAVEFRGRIERDWWLSSFTALTRNFRHDGLSDPDRDRTDLTVAAESEQEIAADARFILAKGADSGNFLHWILETMEFSNPDLTDLRRQSQKRYSALMDSNFPQQQDDSLWSWLSDIVATPLDDTGLSLSSIEPEYCLKETEFYYPMQQAVRHSDLIARLLSDHRGSQVEFPEKHLLKGMMHGFIDLIFEWQGRFYICDYKSNWLGSQIEDYNEEAMTQAVQSSFYDLQYWIYSLALHRYLQVHLPNYKPESHLGGVYYLFLRGMKPGVKSGIYHRQLSVDWLHQLDDALAGHVGVAGEGQS